MYRSYLEHLQARCQTFTEMPGTKFGSLESTVWFVGFGFVESRVVSTVGFVKLRVLFPQGSTHVSAILLAVILTNGVWYSAGN